MTMMKATESIKLIGLMERLQIYVGICLDSTWDLDSPNITLAPANQIIIEGRALTFKCIATGSESVTYNWLLPNKTNVVSNILQSDNINRLDAGSYYCTASSTANNKTLTASTTTNTTVFCKCTINMFWIPT